LLKELSDQKQHLKGYEEQTKKLVAALEKQRQNEAKLISDHCSHLQSEIASL
jgi:hypothetical protein